MLSQRFVVACWILLPVLTSAQELTVDNADPGLIVFVGRQISVQEVEAPQFSRDLKFLARYQVLDVIAGELEGEEVEFTVFDHYGKPFFSEYDVALLYIRLDGGSYYHEKYLFNDVYETVDGRWAGCGDPYRLEPDVHRGAVRPQRIDFLPFEPSPPLSEDERELRYPSESFEFSAGKLTCTEGTYAEDLYRIKLDGVLRARREVGL